MAANRLDLLIAQTAARLEAERGQALVLASLPVLENWNDKAIVSAAVSRQDDGTWELVFTEHRDSA